MFLNATNLKRKNNMKKTFIIIVTAFILIILSAIIITKTPSPFSKKQMSDTWCGHPDCERTWNIK